MDQTFKLSYFIDEKEEPRFSVFGICLRIIWINKDIAVTLPVSCWPDSAEKLEVIAKEFIPEYKSYLRAKKAREHTYILERDRALRNLNNQDRGYAEYKVISRNSGQEYKIKVSKAGSVSCNCEHFFWRKSQCSHIRDWLASSKFKQPKDNPMGLTLDDLERYYAHADELEKIFQRKSFRDLLSRNTPTNGEARILLKEKPARTGT